MKIILFSIKGEKKVRNVDHIKWFRAFSKLNEFSLKDLWCDFSDADIWILTFWKSMVPKLWINYLQTRKLIEFIFQILLRWDHLWFLSAV